LGFERPKAWEETTKLEDCLRNRNYSMKTAIARNYLWLWYDSQKRRRSEWI